VVRASRDYLPTLSAGLDDPKLELIIGDGIDFVRQAPAETYDLIVVDSSDPVGPSEGLFSQAFYQDVYRCLRPGGVMTAQSESPRFNQRAFVELNHCLKDIFGVASVHCYLAFIPTYPTGMWGFSFCAKDDRHPVQDLDRDRAAQFAQAHHLQYYNAGIHQAAFCLPTAIDQMLNG
jgi:spermidine synthase